MQLNYPGHENIFSNQCENYTLSVKAPAFSKNTD